MVNKDQMKKQVSSILEDIEPYAHDDSGLHIPQPQIEKATEKIMSLMEEAIAKDDYAALEAQLAERVKELRTARGIISNTHKRPVKHAGCVNPYCPICEGGLFVCADCGAAEIETEQRVCTGPALEATPPAPKATGFWAGNPGIIPIGEEVIILAVDFTDPDTRKACWVRWWPKIREYPIYLSCDLSDINRDGEALASTGAVKGTDVMVCPQCEGEGSYADGLDDAACTTPCTRCESNGWIVNLASHPRATNTVDAHETVNVSDKPEGQPEPVVDTEPWGYWVKHKYAEGGLVRTPCFIPEESHYTEVLPLYTSPPTSELEAENARLKARVAELEKAIEPFAAVAEHDIGEDEADYDTFWPISNARYSMSGRLRVGHLRAARRVREGGKVDG